jgi:secreted trypsin-like serine protease
MEQDATDFYSPKRLPKVWLDLQDPRRKSSICEGDSGGPVFANETATLQIGIHSRGNCDPSDYSIELTFENVKDWLENLVTQ